MSTAGQAAEGVGEVLGRTLNFVREAPVASMWVVALIYLIAPWEGIGGIVTRILTAFILIAGLCVVMWVMSAPRFMTWLRYLLPWGDTIRGRPSRLRVLHQHRVRKPRAKDRETRRLMRVVLNNWGPGCYKAKVGRIVADSRGRELVECPIIERVTIVPAGFELVVRPTAGLAVDQLIAGASGLESVFGCRVRLERVPTDSVPLVKVVFLVRDVLAKTVALDLEEPRASEVPW